MVSLAAVLAVLSAWLLCLGRPGPVGWLVSLGFCSSSVISSLTFRLPSDRVHKVFPVKANPAKAFVKVEGSSNLAAMLVSWFLLRRRSAEKYLFE